MNNKSKKAYFANEQTIFIKTFKAPVYFFIRKRSHYYLCCHKTGI